MSDEFSYQVVNCIELVCRIVLFIYGFRFLSKGIKYFDKEINKDVDKNNK